MNEDKDTSRPAAPWRSAPRLSAVLVFSLALHCVHAQTVYAQPPAPLRHFELAAGDASVMLNEFSRQSDLQVGFDFNIVRGITTREVKGDLDPAVALKSMLRGTNLKFDFVNDHTLAITPKEPSFLARLWHRQETHSNQTPDDNLMEQVLVAGVGEGGSLPLLGSQMIRLGRSDIDRSGLATTEDFLRTLPQVFGGGPSQDTVLGREAQTNSAYGNGINLRGLDAGATLVLLDGRRIAPSGTAGAFDDISNIPLSIIDHIDVLPDGASARYGADAVGGVVNFVTRTNLAGAQSQVRGGGVTNGAMGERQFSQLFGNSRDSGSDLFAFEYFQRDPLRSQYRWQQTSDLTAWGGSNFNVPFGSPGTITDGSHFWPLPKNATGLSAGSLSQGPPNLYDQRQGTYITPGEDRWSLFGRNTLKLTDSLGLYAQGLFTRRKVDALQGTSNPLYATVPESNPFYVNPTGIAGPVTVITGTAGFFGPPVAHNRVDTGNFALGLTSSLSHGWTANTSLAYTFEQQHEIVHGLFDQSALDAALADPNPATAFNPFGDASNNNPATLAAIGGSGVYRLSSNLKTAAITARGTPIGAPGGDVETTHGAEYRIQNFSSIVTLPGLGTDYSGLLSRRIFATFGELRIPLIGEGNAMEFARRVELSLGARHESYSDIGSATVPKVGLLWTVRKELNLRSTWSRSFRPPILTDMTQTGTYSEVLQLPDPAASTGSTNVLLRFGTNPNLQPEKARTWTFGTDFAPRFLPGATFSLTYFNVAYSGRIDQAVLTSTLLSQPNLAWLVNRNFTQAQVADICNHSTFLGAPGGCSSASLGAVIDNRLRNIALLKTNGIDLIGKYSLDSRPGRFDFGLNGTYLLRYSQANTPDSPLLNIVNTQNNPINFRFRGLAGWTDRGFGAVTFVNFQNSYRDTLSVPNRGIASWTTVDLQLSYELPGDTPGWLGNTQFALSAQNVFNVSPPFVNNSVGVGYDQENGDLYGRLLSFEVRKRW